MMNQNENLTPENPQVDSKGLDESTAAPATAAENEAPSAEEDAPPVVTAENTAPASPQYQAPVPPKKESAHRLFLVPTIFRVVTVLCLIAGLALSVFYPFFTVKIEYDDFDGVMKQFDVEDEVSFSLYDLATDLKGEIDLFTEYNEDVKKIKKETDDKDLQKLAIDLLKADYSAPEDSGNFSAAMTTFITNGRLKDLNEYKESLQKYMEDIGSGKDPGSKPTYPAVGSHRFMQFILYILIFIFPVIFVVIFAIVVIIRVIQTLFLVIKPSPYPKKTDASYMITMTIAYAATVTVLHFIAPGFVLDIPALIPMIALTVVAMVCNIVYRSTTKRIVMKKLNL